jgi:DNA invertase Pin-like site-specific DNA recombinase
VTRATSNTRHILPGDLPNAIKQLEDHEFDRLLSAVLAEQKRRGKTSGEPNATSHKGPVKTTASSLTAGKANAVRAAFKAGVRPSQIARAFGVSQADVRKALASHAAKR